MPKWSLTNKGNVIQCKWNCKLYHEHFVGCYERAVKYFGIEQNEINSYGNLFNIVIYHQTNSNTIRKLSNELYDILISAMAEHKYWVAVEKRHEKALEILNIAKKKGYIIDELICKTINKNFKKGQKINLNLKNRIYNYKLWCKQNDYDCVIK